MEKIDLQILNEFKMERNKYLSLEKIAYSKINELIEENKFFVMDVSHRTKNVKSLELKIKKKSGKYKKITDITDLVGIRIICYFSDTVDAIAKKLTSIFDIDWENSIDKRKTINATQFGYLSLHYICKLSDKCDCDESIKNIPFEIQLKTVLQHAWAEIEHDLGYKSSFGVPRLIRRKFSQVAGLLEVADNQFVEIREGITKYTKETREKIANNDANEVFLDRISLREYLLINKDMLNFINQLQKELNVEVEIIDTENFSEQFNWFGMETIGDVIKMFDNQKEYVYKQVQKLANDFEIDIISSNIILKYMCYGELIKERYSDGQIRKFLSLSIYDKDKIEKQIQELKN